MKEKTKEKNNQVHTHIVIIFIAVLALILAIMANLRMPVLQKNTSYRLYIGMTDQKAQYQLMPETTAIEIIKTTCIANNVGYTISTAEGGYKDDEGLIHAEKTLILELWGVKNETLKMILSDISKRLNTGDIAIEKIKLNRYNWKVKK